MEQSNALIETNALVTNMSKTVLTLASQVVELQNLVTSLKEQVAESAARQPPPERQPKALSPAVVPSSTMTATSSASSHRPGSSILQPAYAAYPQPPSQPVPPLPQPMAFPPPSTAPQQAPPSLPGHSHPSSQHTLHHAPPIIIPSQQKQNHPLSPSTQPQLGMSQQDAAKDAEDTWTEAFMSRDPDALGKLLSRLSPSVLDRVLPDAPQGSLLSQAVILTTIHKVCLFAKLDCRGADVDRSCSSPTSSRGHLFSQISSHLRLSSSSGHAGSLTLGYVSFSLRHQARPN